MLLPVSECHFLCFTNFNIVISQSFWKIVLYNSKLNFWALFYSMLISYGKEEE